MSTEFGIRIKADASGFKGQVGEAKREVEGFGKSADEASIAVASKLGAAVGVAAVAVGTYFVSQVRAGISALDDLDEAAQGLGIAGETLSSLQTTFRAGGVEAGQLTTALTRLNQQIADAAAGNKGAAALFDAMGISVRDAAGNVKAADVVLGEIADRFRQYKDDALQGNLASDLFGRTLGTKMIPTLNKGAEGLTELTGATKKQIEEAAKLQGEVDKLAAAFERLRLRMSGNVAGAVNGAIEGLRNPGGAFALAGIDPGDAAELNSLAQKYGDLARARQSLLAGATGAFSGALGAENRRLVALIDQLESRQRDIARRGLFSDEGYGQQQAPNPKGKSGGGGSGGGRTGLTDEQREEIRLAKELQAIRATGYQAAIRDQEQRERELAQLEEQNQAIRNQIAEFGKTEVELAELRAARLDEAAAAKEQRLARMELVDGNEAEIIQLREQIRLLRERAQLTRAAGGQAGLARAEREASEAALAQSRAIADENAQMVDELRRGLTDAFMRGFEGGKGAARNFFDTVSNMIQTLVLRRLAEGLINQVFNLFGLVAGSGAGNINAGGVSQPVFANGGVMTSGGPLPLARYAAGGVASRPQLALFGEGRTPEAYVPLPDGRTIPVTMQGGAGVTVNVINNAGAQVSTRERNEGGAVTIDVIVDQVEQALAGNVMRGRGALGGAIAGRFGLRMQPR